MRVRTPARSDPLIGSASLRPGKGWFTLLRLYSPLESFFTKEWRLSEIELVK